MQSLTYANKTPLYVNSDIADENKVNYSDLNDIKSVVNANATECGNASSLNTTAKTSLVAGINEVNTNEKNNTYYKTGDSITFTDIILNGFVSSSMQNLYFSLFVPKSLANITTINITSFNAELRGISGYLNNTSGYVQYVGASGYTLTGTKVNDNSLDILLTKSSAFTNATNNTPISTRATITITLN